MSNARWSGLDEYRAPDSIETSHRASLVRANL